VYLSKIRLQDVKCFRDVTLEFPHRDGNFSGWNVILGENGRGKSTILRSIALGVLNPFVAYFALEQHEGPFVRQGSVGRATVTADLLFHPDELQQSRGTASSYWRSLSFAPQGSPEISLSSSKGHAGEETISHVLCYGYGPFRRLESGTISVPGPFQFPQPLSRFTTLFTDEIGLADAARALIDLYIASVDPSHTSHRAAQQTFRAVCEVVDALLPGEVRLHGVTSEKVRFQTAGGVELTEKELSDGYRSFLSVILDLLRHFAARFGTAFAERIQRQGKHIAVNVEAVVLIDEADAHLHPRWQRELGERLRKVFPTVQFIIATHSPFVVQEASDGGLFVLEAGEDGSVQVEQPVESVRGWTASQILTSPVFGLESTRDPATEALIREHSALTAQEAAGKLSQTERARLTTVQQQLATTLSAPGETFAEMQRQQAMADYVGQTLSRLKNDNK
jgi:predicted ATP-binding protein involved in virulence